MFDMFPLPAQSVLGTFSSGSGVMPVAAVPFVRRNGSWQQVPGAETFKTAFNTAVGNGAAQTLWTAGAGNVLYLVFLSFACSVTGRLTVRYNATAISQIFVTANTPYVLPVGPGVFTSPAAATLDVVNNTGGPADLVSTAWGAEVVA